MLSTKFCPKCGNEMKMVFARHVVRNGKIIYPVNGQFLRFFICNCTKQK